MALSVREQIMQNIQTTLAGITIANGYGTDVQGVSRLLQQGQPMLPPMAWILEEDDEVLGEEPLGLSSRHLRVRVVLVLQQDEDIDSASASTAMNAFIADTQKALQVDVRRNNLAVNTEELTVGPVELDEGVPQLLCALVYRVHYRHPYNDPFTVG